MTINSDEAESSRILSLKWKAIIALSLVLALTYTLFYALFNSELIYTKKQKRKQDNAKLDISLINFIKYSDQQLFSISVAFADQLSKNQNSKYDRKKILQQFNNVIVPRLRQIGIDYSAVVNNKGTVQVDWRSQSIDNRDIDDEIPSTVLKRQRFGGSRIYCRQHCMQIAMTAIKGHNQPVLYLLIAQNFQQTLHQFLNDSNLSVVVLIPTSFRDSLDFPKENYLSTWKSHLFAYESSIANLHAMLSSFELHHPWSSLKDNIISYNYGEHVYTISEVPLPEHWFIQSNAMIKIIQDSNSEEFSLLSTKFFGTALGSMIFSAIILLLILWRPLSRLNTIVNALPLLAQSRFQQFQQSLNDAHHSHALNDEVDHLALTATALTHQLSDLHEQVDAHSEKLALNMELLQSKIKFIQQVLDTAQVIIVTQNSQQKILLINDYGLSLMGYPKNEVIGRDFSEFIQYDAAKQHEWDRLADVGEGARKRLRLNSKLICQNGRLREITWLHSYLDSNSSNNNACLLSVGLDVTEAKVAEKQIIWMAEHDSLTGLNNRRSFQIEVDNILKLSTRYHHKAALMFLDLDNFKQINDTQGHQSGDMVIKHIAHTLKRILRDSDILARIGGDEFAIALPQIDAEGSETVATGINKALAELSFPGSSPMNRLSASIGISIYPEHGTTCKDLLASADIAMYRAKQRGRACWQMYSPDDASRSQLHQEVIWRQRIETALEKDLFVLVYQPIMNLHSQEISHYEALIRMQDGDGELIKPTPFIGIAERCGLINEIDYWVLQQVTEKLSSLEKKGSHIHISVNLSAHAFSNQRLLSLLTEQSMKNFLSVSNMILEITETEALQDFSSACQLIKNLKKLGYKFALDDFGVGFSSFYYLQQLPVDYIKIDGSFIQNLANNPQNQILVKAITDVAKGFGKRSIAEYVEDADTLALLHQYQVDFAQGYHVGMPQAEMAHADLHLPLAHAD